MAINKKSIIELIFDHCEKNNNYVFDNELIKKIVMDSGSKTNPYDMTKIDHISKLPKILLDNDYAIAHIGSGKHMFVKGISKICLLYTSDAADDLLCVDLGGSRSIKKKK
mgnify:CR=1 FL=1